MDSKDLEKRFDRLETKVDKVIDTQAEMNTTLVRHAADREALTQSVDRHIKRTDIIEERMLPLTTAVTRWAVFGKLGAVLFAALLAAWLNHLFS